MGVGVGGGGGSSVGGGRVGWVGHAVQMLKRCGHALLRCQQGQIDVRL